MGTVHFISMDDQWTIGPFNLADNTASGVCIYSLWSMRHPAVSGSGHDSRDAGRLEVYFPGSEGMIDHCERHYACGGILLNPSIDYPYWRCWPPGSQPTAYETNHRNDRLVDEHNRHEGCHGAMNHVDGQGLGESPTGNHSAAERMKPIDDYSPNNMPTCKRDEPLCIKRSFCALFISHLSNSSRLSQPNTHTSEPSLQPTPH